MRIVRKIRFIHTADLHLDTPFKGLRHLPEKVFEHMKNSTFVSFERIVTEAIHHEVDLVLISGDLYDGANRSLKAQLFLRKQFERLEEASIEVFAIHGNHDHLEGKFMDLSWPDNVHFFGSSEPEMIPFYKDNVLLAHIYGYSYPRRAVTENIAEKYEVVDGAPYHVALLHGTIGGNTDHDPYAPFSLQELVNKPFDYWALGHIHKRSELHAEPPVVYSGNIQGLNRKEEGARGCYLVELSEGSPKLRFIETSPIQWTMEKVATEEMHHINDLLSTLQLLKENLRAKNVHTVLTVSITVDDSFGANLQDQTTVDDLLEHLQEGEEDETTFVWINRISIERKREDLLNDLGDSHFVTEMLDVFKHLDHLDDVLEPMIKHRKARRFVTNEWMDLDEIKVAAQNLLIESMRESGR